MLANTHEGYGLFHVALHWGLAVLVAILVPLGLWMTGLGYYDPWYHEAPDIHRALGVIAGLLLALRLASRLLQPRPAGRAASRGERLAARAAHALLYLLPLLLVISGYLISTADGRAVSVFGWFEIPATVQGIDGQADLAGEIHFWLAMALLAVVALHVTAALRHHLWLKDDTLRRMVNPFRKPDREESA
jgi:cytochrome b561